MDVRSSLRRVWWLPLAVALLAGLGMGGLPLIADTPDEDIAATSAQNPVPMAMDGKHLQAAARTRALNTAAGDGQQAGDANGLARFGAVLPGPVLEGWPLASVGLDKPEVDRSRFPLTAVAYYYRSGISASPSSKSPTAGFMRRGARVPTAGTAPGSGCKRGRWYRIAGDGYICTRRGFRVGKKPKNPDLHYALPDSRRPWPYKYAEVTNQYAARLYRLPTAEEAQQIARAMAQAKKASEAEWPEVVERQMKGVFFLAIDEPVQHLGETYLRTVYGRYVRQQDVKWLPESSMRGEKLGGRYRLPLAFVYGGDQTAFRHRGRRLHRLGKAAKHARFTVARTFVHKGKRYLADRQGRAVARDVARVARKVRRPSRVPAGAKWIHVDLSEQTLVAYRGTEPLFATILSSGKKGYEPPKGVFRVAQKHLTTTMNGSDPIDGWYEVEEVPWTLYYWESYAMHGAYWHNDFGKARSHGCTNLAPADARWLYYWTRPKMPGGWQAVVRRGTWVTFTG